MPDREEELLILPTTPPARESAVAAAGAALVGEILVRFDDATIRAHGTSMLPAILPGDVLQVRRCCVDEVAIGDVVLFALGERLLAHRVVSISGDRRSLTTRGDNHRHDDPKVPAGALMGRIVALNRRGRTYVFPFRPSAGDRVRSACLRAAMLWRTSSIRLEAVHPAAAR
jgi:signal peptidase I